MKIIIAPDSFKESLSAAEVAAAIKAGFSQVFPDAEYHCIPVADGGEGTTEALVLSTEGRFIHSDALDPLGNPITARWGILGDGHTAIIETAAASGLDLVPMAYRNPMRASSYGTGQLIAAALEHKVKHIIIGLGGSATNDGGAGMLAALGARLLDSAGTPLATGAEALSALAELDISTLDPRLNEVSFSVACDVDNPLLGSEGASAIFGPQKGATPAQIVQLDQNLKHFAQFLSQHYGQDVAAIPGAGAAGGLGAALFALFRTQPRSGIDIVLDAVSFDQQLQGAHLVITGEGRIDHQSLRGKTPVGVAKRAQQLGIPVIALAGSKTQDEAALNGCGIDAMFSVVPGVMHLADALQQAQTNLTVSAKNIATLLKLGSRYPSS